MKMYNNIYPGYYIDLWSNLSTDFREWFGESVFIVFALHLGYDIKHIFAAIGEPNKVYSTVLYVTSALKVKLSRFWTYLLWL